MDGNSNASFCVALYSLHGSLSYFILCDSHMLTSHKTCSSLGPQRTVSHSFTGVTQSILSFSPCSPCELLVILKNSFQIGHVVCLSKNMGRWCGPQEVFCPGQICQGQSAGFWNRVGVLTNCFVIWDKFHPLPKERCQLLCQTSSHKIPLQAWPGFFSLSYEGRRVNVSLGLGPFLLILCYCSSGQPSL